MTAVLVLLLALQQAQTAPVPTTPAPAAPAPAAPPVRRPAPTSSTVQVRVTDRTGAPAQGVQVTAEGAVSRDGVTDPAGQVQFRTMANGTYRMRASADRFVALEKEVVVRAGAAAAPVEFALSLAPSPPAPAAATATATAPATSASPEARLTQAPSAAMAEVKPGDLRILSIVEMWEKTPNPKEPSRLYPIACSGLDNTEMLVVRETFAAPADASVDRMLYVVGGEATLTVNGRDQIVTNGWYAVIPRGTAHAWTRRGRNPVVILSTTGGRPCATK